MEYTDNNVAFEYSLVYSGGLFTLFKEPHTTWEDIKQAKRWLRYNHDVVSIKVVKVGAMV